MNYTKIYNQLIEAAQNRVTPTCYTEKHHAIPRCMGGSDDKSNLVVLTAKEHYMAHRLLELMYPESKKLKFAVWAMCSMSNSDKRRYQVSSRAYKNAKEAIRVKTEQHKTNSRSAILENHKYINIKTNQIFKGVQAAADSIGVNKLKLIAQLTGKQILTSDIRHYNATDVQLKKYNFSNKRKRALIDINTGEVFEGLRDAAESVGVSVNILTKQLKGITYLTTSIRYEGETKEEKSKYKFKNK